MIQRPARLLALLVSIFVTLASQAMTVDEVPNVHVASRTRYVSNPSGVLSPQAEARLNRAIADLWDKSSVELVVVAIDSIDPSMTPEEFATALFEKWGIGKSDKDNGLLLLVARDDRKVQIRTGYGVEGAVPDIIAGRIIRENMYPYFRQGDYDGGVEAAVARLSEVIIDPSVRDELMSGQANDSRVTTGMSDFNGEEVFAFFLKIAGFIAAIMLAIVIYFIFKTRHVDDVERWRRLNTLWLPAAIVAFVTLGLGAIPFGLLSWKMYRVRRHKRVCSHCGTRMKLIDEVHDNDYLSPSQDLEERLNSIDYDVWLCPQCGEKDVVPYVNRSSSYTECPYCHARTLAPAGNRIIAQPTTAREGRGERLFLCRNCGKHVSRPYTIAKLAAPVVIVGGGSGFGGGGGGFGGGSFGGGMTGGGGASGGW